MVRFRGKEFLFFKTGKFMMETGETICPMVEGSIKDNRHFGNMMGSGPMVSKMEGENKLYMILQRMMEILKMEKDMGKESSGILMEGFMKENSKMENRMDHAWLVTFSLSMKENGKKGSSVEQAKANGMTIQNKKWNQPTLENIRMD